MTILNFAVESTQTLRRRFFATGLRRPSAVSRATTVIVALCGLASASCVDALSAISEGPAKPSTKVAEANAAIAARYTTPERSGHFETARRRLVSGALVPSRAFDDTAIWSAISPTTRVLGARGALTDRGYRFEISPDPLQLERPGDTRHTIALRKLSDSEFRWDTHVDFAIGSLTAADVGGMMTQLLVSGEGRDPAVVRATAVAAFPRSSAVMSRIFSIDTLTLRPGAQGATTVTMVAGVRPEGLNGAAPHFAEYLRKYIANSHYRFTITDRGGAMYFEVIGGDHRLSVRYRVKGGSLVSYYGPPRPLPDSLRLSNDFLIHVKMFEVGWKELTTDFIIRGAEHSRGWLIVAQSEPQWQLPLITERLLRSPLRRPFQGAGASFEITVTDSSGMQTNLSRHTHLEVKESPILRFISGLVGHVFNDLDTAVEREEAAYVRELIMAFQLDAQQNQKGIDMRPSIP
jgi:hypothetical protein